MNSFSTCNTIPEVRRILESFAMLLKFSGEKIMIPCSSPDGSKIYEAKKSEKHDLYKSSVILNLTNAQATCFRDVSIFSVLASSSNV